MERRRHSAVWMLTTDANLFYSISPDNTLLTKIHYMQGGHELPGPVHFYSQAPSNENTEEKLAFVQSRWRIDQGKWKFQLLGKLQGSYDFYEDSATNSLTGYIYNDYRQHLAYLSGSLERRLTERLLLSLAVDGDAGRLRSNLAQRNDVTRTHLTATTALRYRWRHLELQGDLLFTDIHDRVADLDTMPGYRRLTPFLSLLWSPSQGTHLRLFYKDSYRAPSFGELYFFQSIPRNLKPEHARQVNLGLTHAGTYQPINISTYQLTLDLYFNSVENKIVARPGHNMYYWTMENLGKVETLGLDATADFSFITQHSTFNVQLNYSSQHAVDRSREDSKIYGHQIVYTPRHSGGGSLRWENTWVNLGATAMVVGERFSAPQNTDANRLPPYCDLGVSADHKFNLRLGTISLRLQVLNLLDIQYEVVRSYPMMGRNWRAAIVYDF